MSIMSKTPQNTTQKIDELATNQESVASVTATKNKSIKPKSKNPNLINISTADDVRKFSKVLMLSIANKDSKYTLEQVKAFTDLAKLFFRADEYIITRRTMNKIRKDQGLMQ